MLTSIDSGSFGAIGIAGATGAGSGSGAASAAATAPAATGAATGGGGQTAAGSPLPSPGSFLPRRPRKKNSSPSAIRRTAPSSTKISAELPPPLLVLGGATPAGVTVTCASHEPVLSRTKLSLTPRRSSPLRSAVNVLLGPISIAFCLPMRPRSDQQGRPLPGQGMLWKRGFAILSH